MLRILLATSIGIILLGCSTNSNEVDPPDLTPKDVVGCWQVHPGDICLIYFMDNSGGAYNLQIGPGDFIAEDSGIFSISGFTVSSKQVLRTRLGARGTVNNEMHLKVSGPKLLTLNSRGIPDGGYLNRATSDSLLCGVKPWQFFKTPYNWDSLIKPII